MNPTNFDSTYIAEVVSVDDPEHRCRVRVNVYDLFDGIPEDHLPWANFVLPLGSRPGEGTATPVHKGDKVWVRFVEGDTRRPLIIGAAQAAPDGKVNLVPDQWGGEEEKGNTASANTGESNAAEGASEGNGENTSGEGQNSSGDDTYKKVQHKRTDKQPEVEEPGYYEDYVSKQNGVIIQITKSGTARVTQIASGSAVEITKDGHVVIHCEGDLFISVEGNTIEEYNGDVEQTIKGNLMQKIEGNAEQKITGTFEQSAKEIESTADGTYIIKGGQVFIN